MDNEIMVMFGTETGNAEELAETAVEMASGHGLTGKLFDMEDVTVEMLQECKRLVVVCSTWGDGEQPVNAQDLYDSTMEMEDGSLENLKFAVLALGDTAFDLFCESGKEWDAVLENKGGIRVNDRIDCDTDYDDFAEDWFEETLQKFQASM
tara:strand:- start:1097 stop:1549 length:453 start_codon:yes stop_codon:yes gene_type:complete